MLGAICGDILGSSCEFDEVKYEDISDIILFQETAHFTDDTVLTCAVADWLVNDIHKSYYDDEQLRKSLAEKFVYWTKCNLEREMAYGFNYMQWFHKANLIQEYEPINSYGNGSSMRVSPVAWAFDTLEETLRFAKISADVMHNHPEGEKGAMCIAAAIFLARKGFDKQYIKDFLIRAFGYEKIYKSVAEPRDTCEWNCICQETVPMAVAAFLESQDYESAIRLGISYGCDCDTVACMTGAIAEAYYGGVPKEITEFCKSKMSNEILKLLEKFDKRAMKS